MAKLYLTKVSPFTDLRAEGRVKPKTRLRAPSKTTIIDPQYREDVERVIEHIFKSRERELGVTRHILGKTWRGKIQTLLRGQDSTGMAFTADQLCDIFDFAVQDPFWHKWCNEPSGLLRKAHKLWTQDEFVLWSLKNDRPESNRPRNTTHKVAPKNQLEADIQGADKSNSWSSWNNDNDDSSW